MAWVEINRDFDFRISHHTTVAFVAGMTVPVTRDALAAILEAGAGAEVPTPPRATLETADAPVSATGADGLDPAAYGADGEGASEPGADRPPGDDN